ncbi:primosomal protein N', partial [Streptococcus agalactiae]|nr:primosomal protein N' [Streptococcus agalactiae]MCK6356136.1 primosomal protein N' [Streptococcus agalactiae]
LKSMLPSLLNSQYDKLLLATDTLPSEDREDLFGHKTEIVFSSLSSQDAKKAGRLIQKGFIEVQYLAKDKKTIKTEKIYKINRTLLEKSQIAARAKKRLELKEFLLENPQPGRLTALNKQFSSPVVNFFREEGIIEVIEKEASRSDNYFKG